MINSFCKNNPKIGEVFCFNKTYTYHINKTGDKYMSFIKDNKIDYFPVIDMIETGKNIQQLRENKGLSVKKLSEIMQLESVQGIYRWQYGKTLPTLENLYLLSEIFEKQITEILVLKENNIS